MPHERYRRGKAITNHFSTQFCWVAATMMSENLCLDCAPQEQSDFPRCTAWMAQKGHSMQQGSIIQAERKIGPDVCEFRWREPGPDANVNIAGWLSVALTSLWMNQQHAEGLLLSILTSISGTHDSRVSPSRYQSWQSTIGN